MATSGVFRAVGLLVDGQARRISGSASASRLVAWSNMGQVVEVDGDSGVFRAVGLLVDGQRAAHQRLGLRQSVRGLEQPSQVIEVSGDVGVFHSVGALVDGQRGASAARPPPDGWCPGAAQPGY